MEVYSDGSCIGNTSRRRFGGVGIWFGQNDIRNSSIPIEHDSPTNQEAELLGLKYSLAFCRNVNDLTIKTDSMYAINCVTKWPEKWKMNGWKTSTGNPVLHVEIIKECLSIMEYRKSRGYITRFRYIKGHSGNEGNEGADVLAKKGADMMRDVYAMQ